MFTHTLACQGGVWWVLATRTCCKKLRLEWVLATRTYSHTKAQAVNKLSTTRRPLNKWDALHKRRLFFGGDG